MRWRSGYAVRGSGFAQRSSSLTPEQLDEDRLKKQRREEKAAELQRHLDEQLKAAEQDTDTEAMQRVFARFGLNKKKGGVTN